MPTAGKVQTGEKFPFLFLFPSAGRMSLGRGKGENQVPATAFLPASIPPPPLCLPQEPGYGSLSLLLLLCVLSFLIGMRTGATAPE